MDGERSRQVSIDVTDTFDDLLIIWCNWNQFICHRSSQFEQVNKMAQLLIAPKPFWTCSKKKKSVCDCLRSLGLFIPLTTTSATFFCGGGSNSKFEGSSPCPMMISRQQWKISMRQYWTNTSAQQQQLSSGARRFCLQIAAISSTFWHLCRHGVSQYYIKFQKSDLVSCLKSYC